MNKARSPCIDDLQYDFAQCVEKSIVDKAGCQPHWIRFKFEKLPMCKNLSGLMNYGMKYLEFSWMPKNELLRATNCLMPCTYMEYRVSVAL